MITLYLEPSALFKAYIPEKGSENIEYVLSNLGIRFVGLTSRWTILEIIRGFVKRKNLGELTIDELNEIIAFFLDDIDRLATARKLKIVEVTKSIIDKAIDLVASENLYAADAIHVRTAELHKAKAILTDDIHVKRLSKVTPLRIINIELPEKKFLEIIKTLT